MVSSFELICWSYGEFATCDTVTGSSLSGLSDDYSIVGRAWNMRLSSSVWWCGGRLVVTFLVYNVGFCLAGQAVYEARFLDTISVQQWALGINLVSFRMEIGTEMSLICWNRGFANIGILGNISIQILKYDSVIRLTLIRSRMFLPNTLLWFDYIRAYMIRGWDAND